MNQETARLQMLKQQVRAWDVLDARVLTVMGDIPREHFVPTDYAAVAFADCEIPLGEGQHMMLPQVEGRLLQALNPLAHESVLEIGTGSGYLAGCLAAMAAEVTSIDIFPAFAEQAASRLAEAGMTNVTIHAQDATTWQTDSRFDAIAVTASVPQVPDWLLRLLKPNGRAFVVVGRAPVMTAQLLQAGDGGFESTNLFETRLTPMINCQVAPAFAL